MSVRIMALAWAVDLPAREKLVLLALADCANDEGRCWPGRATLMAKTGQCMRTLQEALRALDAAGHITRAENPGKGMNYEVHPVASCTTGGKICTGSKSQHRPVAKSAPKPSRRTIIRLEANAPKRNSRAKFVLPNRIPAEPWQAFTEMRLRIGKPMTIRAMELAVLRLDRLAEDGWPPGDVLNNSTLNSYQGLFPPRSDSRNERSSNPTGDALAMVQAAIRAGSPFG